MSINRSTRFLRNLPLLLLCMALVAALGVLWKVRRTPLTALQLPFVYADPLAALMVAIVSAGLVLACIAQRDWSRSVGLRALGLVILAALACFCSLPIGAAIMLFISAALAVAPQIRRPAVVLPLLLAGLAALVAALALTLGGALRYDDPAAGAALSSLVFWFTLLAAVVPVLPLAVPDHLHDDPLAGSLRILFLYPLARLFTLGPWNEGWSLAAMLLGGGVVSWAALATLMRPTNRARASAAQCFFPGLALGALGLASSAGVAAGCYALLCSAVLCAAPAPSSRPRSVGWALAGALPLTAPFMASWLAIGAAAASGATALAGVLWLAALLRGVAILLEHPTETKPHTALVVGSAAVVIGVLAPPIVAYLIQPVVDQLQGGLTPYGNLSIAPWVGIALLDSGSRSVTTAPILAAAGLMLVLVALLFLIARLWQPQEQAIITTEQPDQPDRLLLIADLVRAVPWLGALGSKKGRDHDAR